MPNPLQLIAGVDEVGRGPLAGPVVAAAVILDPKKKIQGLKDSKLLTAKQRDYFYDLITEKALAWGIGSADVTEIDRINILQASLLAMQRAVTSLTTKPTEILVDGNVCPMLLYPVRAIVRGDQTVAEISAASIVAKVTRDREMVVLADQYPGYNLAQNKGYSTREHLEGIARLGVTEIHRKSFAPVREYHLRHCEPEPAGEGVAI